MVSRTRRHVRLVVHTLLLFLSLSASNPRLALAREIQEHDDPWARPAIENDSNGYSQDLYEQNLETADHSGPWDRSRWALSYGTPFVATTWVVEVGDSWYKRSELRRGVFQGGVYLRDEYVGTTEVRGGSVWSYGSDFVSAAERIESGNTWFTRRTYSRPAYRYGAFQYHQYVRTVDEPGGAIWTYGPEFAAEESTVDRGNTWYRIVTYRRAAFRYGIFQGNTVVRVVESPGGIIWTYGPPFVAGETREERGNNWYVVRNISRQVYYRGTTHHLEPVGTEERLGGQVWAYSEPRSTGSSVSSIEPPHLHRVTEYARDVFYYGTKVGTEPVPTLREVSDVCSVEYGPLEQSNSFSRVEANGHTVLVTEFRRPIYHVNPVHGRFTVGYREEPGSTRLVDLGGPLPRSDAGGSTPPTDTVSAVKRAARVITVVEEFDDSKAVLASSYVQDIREALARGIIFGKFNDQTGERPYDPDTLITLGEMVNILARNYSGTALSGLEARNYLTGLGVGVSTDLDRPMSVEQLSTMTEALRGMGTGVADLLVLRQASQGSLQADHDGGITRAHAVAMFHEPVPPNTPPVSTSADAGTLQPVVPQLQPLPQPTPPTTPAVVTIDSGKSPDGVGLTVAAEVEPDRCLAGRTVTIWATTNRRADDCSASTPWGEVAMTTAGGTTWQGQTEVPESTAMGTYEVIVTARRAGERATDTPSVSVVGDQRQKLLFVLTE